MPKPVLRKKPVEQNKKDSKGPLHPYVFLGLDIDPEQTTGEQVVDCPLCGRENKFSLNSETGEWRCFTCGEQGGIWKFLSEIHRLSDEATTDYKDLCQNRGFEFPDSLMAWGVCRSILTDDWLVPGWALNKEGKLRIQQLYKYVKVGDRMALLPTPGQKHTMFGLNLYDKSKPEVYITEGIWDGIRLWEVLKTTKVDEDGSFSVTGSKESCLLSTVNVLSVPSCTVFNETWIHWCKGKSTRFWYDNDHPPVHPKTGIVSKESPAFTGMKRAAAMVMGKTEHTFFLQWGENGYDPNLPNRFDVRDALNQDKFEGLSLLFNRTELVPASWLQEGKAAADTGLKPKHCSSWKVLVNAWRKAVKWTPGLEHGLVSMLASVASTKSIGDQLWFRIIGPPSCGKTTLAEGVSVNKKYVKALSTIRGFHSGFSAGGDDKNKDNSLILQVMGKTLITKDGDTLLQSPNRGQILAEGRDIYDRVSRSHYRTGKGGDYEGINMTWLLCGTHSLRQLDDSELGERFLDCIIMDKIEPTLEDDILWRVVNRAADDCGVESNGDVRSQYTPAMCEAMELSGGYVEWLREEANSVLPTIEFPDEAKMACVNIGKWVAYMRAKKEDRELAARLVSQHTRAAKCIAFVLNKTKVDNEVINRVIQIGMDTSRGDSLEIVKSLYYNKLPMENKAIELYTSVGSGDLRVRLKLLKKLGVVRPTEVENKRAWCLTDIILDLCKKLLPNKA